MDEVRRLYERQPYPAADETPLTRCRWKIPAPDWINSLWRPGTARFQPDRVLIAGCGTGSEAFAVRRRLPTAEIVAVDFSPRSIDIARRLQRRRPPKERIQFVVGDLTSPRLPGRVGGDFDFISCHGVLSYVPDPGRALRTLAACLTPEGALYLGVNGLAHHSARRRPVLSLFGVDPTAWRRGPSTRRVLKLLDAMGHRWVDPPMSGRSEAYLAGDLFGPLFKNLPLASWLTLARKAGLHFRGSDSWGDPIRSVCERGLSHLLRPRSRVEFHEIEELLMPSPFHRLLFTRHPQPTPPWDDVTALLAWRPVRLPVHTTHLPSRARSWDAVQTIRSDCRAMNMRLTLRLESWETELLRNSRGKHSLGEILGQIPFRIRPVAVRNRLYMLYLLLVLDLLPPAPSMS